MSEALDNSIERFRRLPRAIQWALVAAVVIGSYLLWDSYLQPTKQKWDDLSEHIEERVTKINAGTTDVRALQNMQDVVTNLGPVNLPRGEKEVTAVVNDVVEQVMKKNAVSAWSFSFRSKGNLPKTSLVAFVKGNERVERRIGDLKFEAAPKAAVAIIAELESSPDIEAVDSLRITRDAGGKVKVQLTIETWVLTSEGSPTGATA